MKKTVYSITIFIIITITVFTSCSSQTIQNSAALGDTARSINVTPQTIDSGTNDFIKAPTTRNSNDSPGIVVTTPITVSVTDLYPFRNKHEYLRLKMVNGKYIEEWQPAIHAVPIITGYFILELVDEDGNVLSKTDLSKTYERTVIDINGNVSTDTEPLEFKGSFNFELDDYNNDGDMDFTLGQHASSNGNNYRLFTIRKNGEIEELHVKDNPELYITGGEYYSTRLKKVNNVTFKIKQFFPGENTKELFFKWVNNEFELTEGRIPNGIAETDIPPDWKVYRYSDYGYEIAYPREYNAALSGGHSPVANPELGMRLSLSSKDNQPGLDIDSINKVDYKDKYQNVEEYIKYKHLTIMFDENITINNKANKIYKLKDDNHYFSFFENENYIFQFSSNSKEILKKIMTTFIFV